MERGSEDRASKNINQTKRRPFKLRLHFVFSVVLFRSWGKWAKRLECVSGPLDYDKNMGNDSFRNVSLVVPRRPHLPLDRQDAVRPDIYDTGRVSKHTSKLCLAEHRGFESVSYYDLQCLINNIIAANLTTDSCPPPQTLPRDTLLRSI